MSIRDCFMLSQHLLHHQACRQRTRNFTQMRMQTTENRHDLAISLNFIPNGEEKKVQMEENGFVVDAKCQYEATSAESKF